MKTNSPQPEAANARHDSDHTDSREHIARRNPQHRGRITGSLLAACGLAAIAWLLGASGIGAEGSTVPGMCKGRSDANVVLNAHAQNPKFILNVSTDAIGMPYGVLILEKGETRLYVDLFCRLWKHLPGQETGGECEGESPHGAKAQDEGEGATMVHVVGMGNLQDGSPILVRADMRETEEGKFFRVRYRVLGEHGGHEEALVAPTEHEDEGDHEDESWTKVPVEGWAALKLLKVRVVTD